MRRFTQLFIELDRTTRTSEKLAAMERYFREAPPADAAWALFFLSGQKIKRLLPWRVLDDAIRHVTGLPDWLVRESYEAVGDGAELMALLFPDPIATVTSTATDVSTASTPASTPDSISASSSTTSELARSTAKCAGAASPSAGATPNDIALHELVHTRLLGLRSMATPQQQRDSIIATWAQLDVPQRLVFNKLLTGNFRVGVAHTLLARALAAVAGIPTAHMAHRLAGTWTPDADRLHHLLRPDDPPDHHAAAGSSSHSRAQPYPFFLAYPLEQPPSALGDRAAWQLEWKYDGLRAQISRRADRVDIWSRGEELITQSFPELADQALEWPVNTALDGEIVAWEAGAPLPFALLQRRINRAVTERSLWVDVPVAFLAFDILEDGGDDVRARALSERRRRLGRVLDNAPASGSARLVHLAPLLIAREWTDVAALRSLARSLRVEGVMLKRLDSPYGVGRRRGDWWKWKVDPFTLDAVLIHAQAGSGRRSGLFTDYTFGLWTSDDQATRELVPVAKAYSGLTDDEIRLVDRFIRSATTARRGPVRIVRPELVFELAFEGIQESTRHKAGLALRFPRMHRWRHDKQPADADSLATLRALLAQALHAGGGGNA